LGHGKAVRPQVLGRGKTISVRPGPLLLAKYYPLWLRPTRLPHLTVFFLAAHRPQNDSYKVRYLLP